MRHGSFKLILFGQAGMSEPYPPLLFDLARDPFELQNLAPQKPTVVKAMRAMLDSLYNHTQVDRDAKADDVARYRRWVWNSSFAHGGCMAVLAQAYHGFDAADAAKIATWSGAPCE